MKAAKERQANRRRFDEAARFGLLQQAIAVLGGAQIGHLSGAYLVSEFGGGRFVVRLRGDKPHCITCESDSDEHASLVRLYLARIGEHGLGA